MLVVKVSRMMKRLGWVFGRWFVLLVVLVVLFVLYLSLLLLWGLLDIRGVWEEFMVVWV